MENPTNSDNQSGEAEGDSKASRSPSLITKANDVTFEEIDIEDEIQRTADDKDDNVFFNDETIFKQENNFPLILGNTGVDLIEDEYVSINGDVNIDDINGINVRSEVDINTEEDFDINDFTDESDEDDFIFKTNIDVNKELDILVGGEVDGISTENTDDIAIKTNFNYSEELFFDDEADKDESIVIDEVKYDEDTAPIFGNIANEIDELFVNVGVDIMDEVTGEVDIKNTNVKNEVDINAKEDFDISDFTDESDEDDFIFKTNIYVDKELDILVGGEVDGISIENTDDIAIKTNFNYLNELFSDDEADKDESIVIHEIKYDEDTAPIFGNIAELFVNVGVDIMDEVSGEVDIKNTHVKNEVDINAEEDFDISDFTDESDEYDFIFKTNIDVSKELDILLGGEADGISVQNTDDIDETNFNYPDDLYSGDEANVYDEDDPIVIDAASTSGVDDICFHDGTFNDIEKDFNMIDATIGNCGEDFCFTNDTVPYFNDADEHLYFDDDDDDDDDEAFTDSGDDFCFCFRYDAGWNGGENVFAIDAKWDDDAAAAADDDDDGDDLTVSDESNPSRELNLSIYETKVTDEDTTLSVSCTLVSEIFYISEKSQMKVAAAQSFSDDDKNVADVDYRHSRYTSDKKDYGIETGKRSYGYDVDDTESSLASLVLTNECGKEASDLTLEMSDRDEQEIEKEYRRGHGRDRTNRKDGDTTNLKKKSKVNTVQIWFEHIRSGLRRFCCMMTTEEH